MDQGHRERILVVFDPAISEKRAWHAKQTVMAISNGQLTGDGYLHGARTQGGWIPEAHCDSIFAVCAEEFGFIGAMVLLALLTALVLRIFYDCWRATDTFSAMVCAGVGGMFLWQIAINVTMNLGVFPVIGLTLPLVSAMLRLAGCSSGRGDCARGGWSAGRCGASSPPGSAQKTTERRARSSGKRNPQCAHEKRQALYVPAV